MRGLDIEFPLQRLVVVTGVSGSGKSTLIQDVLFPALSRYFGKATETPGADRVPVVLFAGDHGIAAQGVSAYPPEVTVQMLDGVKNLGFLYATRAGISIGIDDMVVPGEKAKLVRDAEKAVIEVQSQYQEGAITQGERYNKIIEIWSKVTERVSDEMFKSMEEDDRTGR